MGTKDSVTLTLQTGAVVLLASVLWLASGRGILAAPAPAPGTPPVGYAAALKLYSEGKYAESLDLVRKSVSAGNLPFEMRMLAAATYVGLGKPANAIAHLQLCIREHPKRVEPRLALSGVYRTAGRTAEALGAARGALALAKDQSSVRLELARAHYGGGQFERSREQIAAILKSQPKQAEAVMLDGLNLLRQGKLENAEFRLQQALHLKLGTPADLAATYNNLGLCYELRARRLPGGQEKAARQYLEEATRYYKYALETIPRYGPALRNLARVRPGG